MDTLKKLERNGVHLKYEDVVRLCEKYMIEELSIFGSSIREDFSESSDVDILITYKPEAEFKVTLFDEMDLEDEFARLTNRDVDICDKDCLNNPLRREDILASSEVVYVSR